MQVTLAAVLVGVVALGVLLAVNVLGGSNQVLQDPAEPVPAALANGRTLGKADAPVKMDVWEDFQCPNCDTFSSGIEPRLVNQFVLPGTLQITFHDFLVIDRGGSHESLDAAAAARCAGDQGKFWLFGQYLFANQGAENSGTFTRSLFDSIATKIGLSLATFDTCLGDPAKPAAVQAEANEGVQKGVSGTPAVFVNGEQRPDYSLTALTADVEAAAKGQPLPGSSGAPGAPSSAPPESTLPPGSASPGPAASAASPTP
jgi:protein-disulfide isomerase